MNTLGLGKPFAHGLGVVIGYAVVQKKDTGGVDMRAIYEKQRIDRIIREDEELIAVIVAAVQSDII